MLQKKDAFQSQLGLILACAGSAIGLGNIWRFPYIMSQNGGTAFLILYVLCVIAFGVPLLSLELILGKRSHRPDVVSAYSNPDTYLPMRNFSLLGIFTAILAIVILTFYSIISGWLLRYLTVFINGDILHLAATPKNELLPALGSYFSEFTQNTYSVLFYQILFVVMTIGIVIFGIKKGIERFNLYAVNLLIIILVALFIYTLQFNAFSQTFAFMFSFDFSQITPDVFSMALAQAFFTLSIGGGAIMTYGAYMKKDKKNYIPKLAFWIVFLDTLVAILFGIFIFNILFAFEGTPQEGLGLVTNNLSLIFLQMPLIGQILGIAFFFLILLTTLSSSISLLEPSLSVLVHTSKLSRPIAAIILGLVIILLGLPAIFNWQIPKDALPSIFQIGSRDLVSYFDILISTGGWLVYTALAMVLYALFIFNHPKKPLLKEELLLQYPHSLNKKIMYYFVQVSIYLLPLVILFLIISSV